MAIAKCLTSKPIMANVNCIPIYEKVFYMSKSHINDTVLCKLLPWYEIIIFYYENVCCDIKEMKPLPVRIFAQKSMAGPENLDSISSNCPQFIFERPFIYWSNCFCKEN